MNTWSFTQSLLYRFWKEPPVIFPMAAIFHLYLLVSGFIDLGDTIGINWPSMLWYITAFLLSIFCLLLKRRAAIAYIMLAIAGLLLQYALPVSIFWKNVGSTLFPFDILYTFFLLFFYKRFR